MIISIGRQRLEKGHELEKMTREQKTRLINIIFLLGRKKGKNKTYLGYDIDTLQNDRTTKIQL